MQLTRWSLERPVLIMVMVVLMVLSGLYAYVSLPREANPDITVPFINVTTVYPGVSSEDIEKLVTDPLEEELDQLKDVRKLNSVSSEGVSVVALEFEPDIEVTEALRRVREGVDTAKPDLPESVEEPLVKELSFSEFPVMVINISGDVDRAQLGRIGERMAERIEAIPGVLEARVAGKPEREIAVEADLGKMDHYGVTLAGLSNAIAQENLDVPGGAIEQGESKLLVRVPGEFSRASEMEGVVIKRVEGRPVHVRDVATVMDGFEKVENASRMNAKPSVSISVVRRAGENVLRINDEARSIAEELNEQMDGSVEVSVVSDASKDINSTLSELENNIITSLLLVFVVLLFFMGGFRNAMIVAVAIPLSMSISFAVLSAMGVTLSQMVLYSLVLALGLLVDNAIVMVENIYRHASLGKSPFEAALDGAKEVSWPIIASTATTVLAFLPMLFWPGVMGQFMGFLPMTVIIVLSASLFVALVVTPVLSALWIGTEEGAMVSEDEPEPEGALYGPYKKMLQWAVGHRGVVLAGVMILFVGTFGLFGRYSAGVEFFPETEPDEAIVDIKLPDGASFEASDRVVSQVEAMVAQESDIEAQVAEIGSSGTARSQISLIFVDKEARKENTLAVIDRLRSRLARLPGVETQVKPRDDSPASGAPVNLEFVGDDLQVMASDVSRARQRIKNVPGLVELRSDFEEGRAEITVQVDREAAAVHGVSTQGVAMTVRGAVQGITSTQFREDGDEIDVVVRLNEQSREDLEDVSSMLVMTGDETLIPVSEVATVQMRPGLGSIRHLEGDRVITLSAQVQDGFNDNEVLAAVQERLAEFKTSAGVEMRYTGQSQDQQEAADFLSKAMLVAVFLIFLVLVAQFNSTAQPIVILSSVVLSLLGVLWILMVRQMPFSVIMTGIGVVSLAGIVVNNAIVLIDYINQLKSRGMSSADAVVRAGMVRLRPVLLTATTTALSLLPTVLGVSLNLRDMEVSMGGNSVIMWGPMANAIVAGLVVATLLTLLIVPVMVNAVDDIQGGWARMWSSLQNRSSRKGQGAAEIVEAGSRA